MKTKMAAKKSLLLDLLQTRESLWNSKHESYRNRNIRKAEYEDMLEGPSRRDTRLNLADFERQVELESSTIVHFLLIEKENAPLAHVQ